ncbi:unnamed protein product [Amoebophrya sp. A120]|nr:unnamed protein product [Amoebophrya sp. A120]|eukprot:GSA120T00002927001.1
MLRVTSGAGQSCSSRHTLSLRPLQHRGVASSCAGAAVSTTTNHQTGHSKNAPPPPVSGAFPQEPAFSPSSNPNLKTLANRFDRSSYLQRHFHKKMLKHAARRELMPLLDFIEKHELELDTLDRVTAIQAILQCSSGGSSSASCTRPRLVRRLVDRAFGDAALVSEDCGRLFANMCLYVSKLRIPGVQLPVLRDIAGVQHAMESLGATEAEALHKLLMSGYTPRTIANLLRAYANARILQPGLLQAVARTVMDSGNRHQSSEQSTFRGEEHADAPSRQIVYRNRALTTIAWSIATLRPKIPAPSPAERQRAGPAQQRSLLTDCELAMEEVARQLKRNFDDLDLLEALSSATASTSGAAGRKFVEKNTAGNEDNTQQSQDEEAEGDAFSSSEQDHDYDEGEDNFNEQDVANATWAFTQFPGVEREGWYHTVSKIPPDYFTAQGMNQVLYALTKANHPGAKVFGERVQGVVLRKIREDPNYVLSKHHDAVFSTPDSTNPASKTRSKDTLVPSVDKLTSRTVGNLIWACAVAKVANDEFNRKLGRLTDAENLIDVCNISWGLAAMKTEDEALYSKFARYASEFLMAGKTSKKLAPQVNYNSSLEVGAGGPASNKDLYLGDEGASAPATNKKPRTATSHIIDKELVTEQMLLTLAWSFRRYAGKTPQVDRMYALILNNFVLPVLKHSTHGIRAKVTGIVEAEEVTANQVKRGTMMVQLADADPRRAGRISPVCAPVNMLHRLATDKKNNIVKLYSKTDAAAAAMQPRSEEEKVKAHQRVQYELAKLIATNVNMTAKQWSRNNKAEDLTDYSGRMYTTLLDVIPSVPSEVTELICHDFVNRFSAYTDQDRKRLHVYLQEKVDCFPDAIGENLREALLRVL